MEKVFGRVERLENPVTKMGTSQNVAWKNLVYAMKAFKIIGFIRPLVLNSCSNSCMLAFGVFIIPTLST